MIGSTLLLSLLLLLGLPLAAAAGDQVATVTGNATASNDPLAGSCLEPIVGLPSTVTLSWIQDADIPDGNANDGFGFFPHTGSGADPWMLGRIDPGDIELLCEIGYIETQNDLFSSDVYIANGQQCSCDGDPLDFVAVSLVDSSSSALDSDDLPDPIPALDEFDSRRLIFEGCAGAACAGAADFRLEYQLDTLQVPEPRARALAATVIVLLPFLRRSGWARGATGA